jgi:hypothetical protein
MQARPAGRDILLAGFRAAKLTKVHAIASSRFSRDCHAAICGRADGKI